MALYLVLRDDGQENVIHVYKCTGDPATPANWVAQDSHGFPGPIKTVQATVQNSDIHIAVAGITQDTPPYVAYVRYCAFDPGTDAFTVTNEVVDNGDCLYTGETTTGDRTTCGIAVRSDGDVIVPYIDTDLDVNYSRRESAVWTRGTTVYDAISLESVIAVMGASDRTHFFMKGTGDNLNHRSLNAANTLGSSTIGVDTTISGDRHAIVGAVAFNDGTARVRVIYKDAATADLSASYSNDQENWSGTVEADFSDYAVRQINQNEAADVALDEDDTWVLYTRVTANDIYSDSNDGITGWGVDNEENDAVDSEGISCGVYVRGADLYLGYVWYDGTTNDLNFDEIDLMKTAAGFAFARLFQQNFKVGPFSA